MVISDVGENKAGQVRGQSKGDRVKVWWLFYKGVQVGGLAEIVTFEQRPEGAECVNQAGYRLGEW